jgi:predicted PurR-regulated permease PerM
MNSAEDSSVDQRFVANALAAFVQIAAVAILIYWCFTIISPFVSVVVWALILSVALYPTHVALSARLGGREKLSAAILVLIGLAIIAIPVVIMADSTLGALHTVAAELEDGTAQVPPPADKVADWPVIGKKVHAVWSAAATNLEETVNQFRPQIRSAGKNALAIASHTIGSAFLFVFSMIIAGVLFTTASGGYAVARNIASTLAGTERGPEFTDMAILTIRSVAKGVLGIALIQAILSAIGLVIAGVPAAGLWAAIVLALAIIQLPPLVVLGPIAIWYFSVAEPIPATIFLVFAIIVSVSDAFLKPLFLGRGIDVPMPVILIGAIGGAIAEGIIGLFTGAVVLAVGYEIFLTWMAPGEAQVESSET